MLKSLTPFLKHVIVKNYRQYKQSYCFASLISSCDFKKSYFHIKTPECNAENEAEHNSNRFPSVLTTVNTKVVSTIKSFKHTDEILEFLRNNANIDAACYEPLFSTMLQLQKSGNSRLSRNKLRQTKEIEFLLKKVDRNLRLLTVNQILTIFKTLLFLEVPSTNNLSRKILQTIAKNLNQLKLNQLMVLSSLLKKCQSNQLIDGLKIALPVILDNTLRVQFEHEDPADVVEAFIFAFETNNISNGSLQLLIESTFKIKDQLSCKEAYLILNALCNKDVMFPNQMVLYHDLMENVANNMHDCLTFNEVNHLVSCSLRKYVYFDVSYYNQELISEAVKYVIEKKLNINLAGKLLRNLNKVSYHLCNDLLDYMDKLIFNSNNLNDKGGISTFISLLTACANVSYKPKYWDMYQDKLVNLIEKNKEANIPIVNITISFILMDCWPSSLIEYCFKESFLRDHLKRKNSTLNHLVLLDLYQLVRIFYPGGYKNDLPPAHVIIEAIKFHKHYKNSSTMDALAHGLGSHKYVLNGVRTRFGHYLDHLIVKDKDGNAVVINEKEKKVNSETLIDSLDIPLNGKLTVKFCMSTEVCWCVLKSEFQFCHEVKSKLLGRSIAILCLNPASYLLDGIKIRGKVKQIIRSVEALGIVVIPISKIRFKELSDLEKPLYLLNEIDTAIKTAPNLS